MTLKELHQPNMTQWLKLAALNWAEIITLYFAAGYIDHWAGYLVAWILLGTRIHALALLGHEGIHYNLSRNRKLNDIVGNIIAVLPLVMTINWFRKFHLTHHSHMLTEHDPEVALRAHSQAWNLPMTKGKRLRLVLLDLSGLGFLESRHVLAYAWKFMTVWDLIWPTLYWAVIWAVAWKLDVLWVPAMWAVSIPTSYWTMFRQRALTEHIGVVPTYRFHARPLQRFFYLPHNTWYHWEHHEWANIPCWNLPAARKLNTAEPVVTLSELFHSLANQH